MSLTITQDLFLKDSTTFTVVKHQDDAVNVEHLQPLLDAALADRVLGISATYDTTCRLSSIAFATLSSVLVVNISKPTRHGFHEAKRRRIAKCNRLIQDRLLLNPKFHKYAFTMDQLAVALHLDLSIRISDAVDMISVAITDDRHSLEALMNAMGGELKLNKKNVQSLFFNHSEPINPTVNVALKAWAACRAATLPDTSSRFVTLSRIDTKILPRAHLDALASISRDRDRLEALKPVAVRNDVEKEFAVKKGTINLSCDRFSTRIRQSKHQVIQIEIGGKGTTTQVTGRTGKVSGRSAQINVNQTVKGDKVISVTTIGKDDPTCAESTRRDIVLETLQHQTTVLSNPFFQALWLPDERLGWPKPQRWSSPPVHFPRASLNLSQERAVQRILSDKDDDRIVMIQGPPGTGKTTVIAASVMSFDHADYGRNIWIAAHSNVAVKNIAEKFIKEGFLKFRLLVSKEFHFDWHEDLYEDLEQCLVRSDAFPKSAVAASRVLCGSEIILCTLSMLSNPNVDVFLRVVPVEMLILDEASQIECGDYLPIFHRFHLTLSKLVFVGDDKQLPPYGQEDIPELRSVFEFAHLRRRALFLDTQYRMPYVIGSFISQNVYGNKLSTVHPITASDACYFVDVNKGREVKKGRSWINEEEARAVMKLAWLHQSKEFRIITPYDAQRNLIEKMLKSEGLPWQDKVFNVDSFQGNEGDHIIVSVVRSRKPGFLVNHRRTNVMLTRCKKSMFICSSRAFLFGVASDTLVGKLAAAVGRKNWKNGRDLLQVGGRM